MNYVQSAIKHIGLTKLGRKLGFYPSAVQKWRDDDCLPRSELAGLTHYAEAIVELAGETGFEKKHGERLTAKKLIEHTRMKWTAKTERARS